MDNIIEEFAKFEDPRITIALEDMKGRFPNVYEIFQRQELSKVTYHSMESGEVCLVFKIKTSSCWIEITYVIQENGVASVDSQECVSYRDDDGIRVVWFSHGKQVIKN